MGKVFQSNMMMLALLGIFINCQAEPASKASSSTRSVKRLPESDTVRYGVYIYRKTVDNYQDKLVELVNNCSFMGISEVYLSFSNKSFEQQHQTYGKQLQQLIQLFHQKNITVFAVSFDTPILLFKPEKIERSAKNILSFNSEVPKDSRFDGVSADLEPHMLKKKRAKLWGETEIYWSNEGYGKGNDNDKLVTRTYQTLQLIKKSLGQLPFSEAVPAFMYSRFQKGELSDISADHFLNSGCQFLLLMVYNNTAEKVIDKGNPFFDTTKQPKSIMLTLKTSIDTSGGEGAKTSFSGLNQQQFNDSLETMLKTFKQNPSFRGIAFFEYNGLEEIWFANAE